MKVPSMKTPLGLWAAALISGALVGCASVPVDGDAVECGACDTLWIRLFESSGAPGLYRLNHDERHEPCTACRARAMEYFETGRLPDDCPVCHGRLGVRPVAVSR